MNVMTRDEIFVPQDRHAELFAQLCVLLDPGYICDIGTLDCTDSKTFAHHNPNAQVIAFEANPQNFFGHCLPASAQVPNLSVQHIAVSNTDGIREFKLPRSTSDVDITATGDLRGMGSLRSRRDFPFSKNYRVATLKLSSFFSNLAPDDVICLWVDVEGLSKEVMEGAVDLMGHIPVIKLELETIEYWDGQSIDTQVIDYMSGLGFDMIARSDPIYTQYDAVFIRRDLHHKVGDFLLSWQSRSSPRVPCPPLSASRPLYDGPPARDP